MQSQRSPEVRRHQEAPLNRDLGHGVRLQIAKPLFLSSLCTSLYPSPSPSSTPCNPLYRTTPCPFHSSTDRVGSESGMSQQFTGDFEGGRSFLEDVLLNFSARCCFRGRHVSWLQAHCNVSCFAEPQVQTSFSTKNKKHSRVQCQCICVCVCVCARAGCCSEQGAVRVLPDIWSAHLGKCPYMFRMLPSMTQCK